MSEYRRLYQPGGSYFFTIVTYQRIKVFSLPENIFRLQSAFDKVMNKHPFTMEAFVILPDHVHCIWRMPSWDSNYSIRWRLIKSDFSARFNSPVNKRGEKEVWQRRFWEHLLRDEEDWRRHMDYIHYNPVKHGYVKNPGDWPHSSFQQAIREGLYASDFGAEVPNGTSGMELE
jgi:putative transposase